MAASARSAHTPITRRELNRALLARQMLLGRERVGVVPAIERLGALQAQWPPAPYVALWSRLESFAITDLEGALADRLAVKATLMRGTLHIVSARDYPFYAVATPEARAALWKSRERQILGYAGTLSAEARRAVAGRTSLGDSVRLHAAMLRFARTPRSREELIDFLAEHTALPVVAARYFLWSFVAAYGGLVQAPPSGSWSQRGSGRLIAAKTWLRRSTEARLVDAVAHSVRRHLAAFGPATVDDISSWTSIRTPLIRVALTALGAKARTFLDERGRVLYDLARSPRPAADVPAPVRYLAKWDSPLLAYSPAERGRILPEAYRRLVVIKNGDVAQTFLVDGMVAGRWEIQVDRGQAVLTLRPFGRLGRAHRAALIEEGERLARFVRPEARGVAVRA